VRESAVPKYKSQRDCVRRLVAQLGRLEELVVREYAAAERRGDVLRRSDLHDLDAESYARAIWADGVRKRWF
jgi:hypothetical protein